MSEYRHVLALCKTLVACHYMILKGGFVRATAGAFYLEGVAVAACKHMISATESSADELRPYVALTQSWQSTPTPAQEMTIQPSHEPS